MPAPSFFLASSSAKYVDKALTVEGRIQRYGYGPDKKQARKHEAHDFIVALEERGTFCLASDRRIEKPKFVFLYLKILFNRTIVLKIPQLFC